MYATLKEYRLYRVFYFCIISPEVCMFFKKIYLKLFTLLILLLPSNFCGNFSSDRTDVHIATTHLPNEGGEFYVVVTFKPKNGWHLYWENPGDSGMPPKVNFKLPNTQDTSTLLGYPAPKLLKTPPLTSFVYDEPFSLVYQLNVNTNIKPEDISIDINWLTCKHTACAPETTTVTLKEAEIITTKAVQNIVDTLPQLLFKGEAYQTHNGLILRFPKKTNKLKSAYFFSKNTHQIEYDAKQILDQTNINNFQDANIELKIQPFQKIDHISGYLTIEDDNGKTTYIVDHPIVDAPYIPTPHNIIFILFLAFIGGLCLNLMPCVFPVLSLKVLSLMNYAPTRASTLRHGFSYTLGIFVSFMALFISISVLKNAGISVGWGFQLQSPTMLCLLIVIFFLLALNLLGSFEFKSFTPSYKFQRRDPSKASSSFLNGVLTTVVATPCTAPFMGTAIAVGLSQSYIQSFGVFTMLSLGLSLPFLLLAIWPKNLKYLPKPGPWMIKFKELLSIPMLAACLWLLWVLESLNPLLLFPLIMALTSLWILVRLYSTDQNKVSFHVFIALAWMALYNYSYKTPILSIIFYGLLLLSFLYIINKIIESFKIYSIQFIQKIGFELIVAFGLSFTVLPLMNLFSHAHHIEQPEPFSKEVVEAALQANRPVFINYTARWCITCQVNKSTVIESNTIKKLFKEKNVLYVEADWTNYNPSITKSLQEHKRESIPLYVIRKPGEDKAIILPELLTEKSIMTAFQ